MSALTAGSPLLSVSHVRAGVGECSATRPAVGGLHLATSRRVQPDWTVGDRWLVLTSSGGRGWRRCIRAEQGARDGALRTTAKGTNNRQQSPATIGTPEPAEPPSCPSRYSSRS